MQIKDRSSAISGGNVCSHLTNAAVALGGDAQALVIEQASVVADGVPARRPSRRVQLLPFGEFSARDGRPYGMRVQVAEGTVSRSAKPSRRDLGKSTTRLVLR